MPNNYWQSRFAELAYFIRNCCIRISKFVIVTLHYIILQLKVRTHNAIAPWSPLIATSGACHILAVLSNLPPSHLAESLLRTSDVDTRLRSADTAMLVVPSTRRSTLGDHAFPVASARAWNSLPSSVRNALSLTTFRRELKTVLFRSPFDVD